MLTEVMSVVLRPKDQKELCQASVLWRYSVPSCFLTYTFFVCTSVCVPMKVVRVGPFVRAVFVMHLLETELATTEWLSAKAKRTIAWCSCIVRIDLVKTKL